jgi:hypothetical protein
MERRSDEIVSLRCCGWGCDRKHVFALEVRGGITPYTLDPRCVVMPIELAVSTTHTTPVLDGKQDL